MCWHNRLTHQERDGLLIAAHCPVGIAQRSAQRVVHGAHSVQRAGCPEEVAQALQRLQRGAWGAMLSGWEAGIVAWQNKAQGCICRTQRCCSHFAQATTHG